VKIRKFGRKWRADAGVILGRRTQRVFHKQKDAELWLQQQDKIKRDDRLGIRRISRAREHLASLAFEHLGKHGLEDESLLDAVRRYCSIAAPNRKTGLGDAIATFERDLAFGNRSPIYIAQIGRQLARFHRSFSDRSLHEVDGDQIRIWLEANCATASNRQNRRRELRVFFSWCVKQGLIGENPVDRVPRVMVERGRPEILNIGQVRSALKNLSDEDRSLFAIGLFAGLRPSEAEALRWEHIKLSRKFLEVRGARHGERAGDNRIVHLSENLVAWLKPLRRESGLVFAGHSRRWRDRVQKAIAVSADPLPEWPQDVLRHSFGSYHLAKHKDAAKTAYEMGHRGNPRMLYDHYRELVTPEHAREFWKIVPTGR
jgi:integrase